MMFKLPSYLWRFGPWILAALLLVGPGVALRASQDQPASQLPDAVRGEKIYRLPSKDGRPGANPAVYKNLTFRDINFDRLLLALSVSIRPVDHAATVERMYFQDVRANGIPVHIETFDHEFKLSTRDSVDVPAPLNCSIVFADLDSMQPVRQMVDKDNIQITGQSFIEVRLGALEKIALRAKQVVIPVDLHEEVPLNVFSGNPILRTTADTILDALANPTSAAAMSMTKEHVAKLRIDAALGGKAKPALYLLCTVYSVRDPKSHASEQFMQSGTGFLVGVDGKLLTTKRVIEPWKFDPQTGFLIEHQHLELDPESVKTYAWPAGAQVMTAEGQPSFPSALSTGQLSLKVLQLPPDEIVTQDYQDPDSGEKATLHIHAEGPADLALLQLSGTGFQPLLLADSAADPNSHPKLALCGFPFGLNQPQASFHLVAINLALQGANLSMDHKADPGESGAPVLDLEGKVVGLAGSESQCIPIQAARKLLP